MEAVFVPGTSDDLETFLILMQEFYAYDQHVFEEAKARGALETFLADDTWGIAWLIYVEGVLAGYMVLTFGYSLEFGGRDAFVDELYLREAYRGQGIGGQSIAHMKAACRARDIRALHLEVERENTATLAFYRKTGFVEDNSTFMTCALA